MDNENDVPTLAQVEELPLEERGAAFAAIERDLRLRLDDQSR
ncbi:MAG: hypothetical protein RLZZ319_490 [Actinomycetota bacterium]|jgi:hypothetical protein